MYQAMFQHLSYVLLDAARLGLQMNEAKARNKANDSLYRGGSEPPAGIAPYIFQFAHATPFSIWYLKKGWGDAWGLLIKSSWPLQELHKHFRKFLKVTTESQQELYFRFYDPRVLRVFLPTCDATQIREFFGNNIIDYFICEDEDPDYALRFSQQNGILKTERFPVKEEIAALPEPGPLPAPKEDPLPPETVAALKAQGIPVPEPNELASTAPQVEAAAVPEAPDPENGAKPLPPPQAKSKWKMFD